MKIELCYVELIQNNEIIIKCSDKLKFNFLKKILAKKRWFSSDLWVVKYKDDHELAQILGELRDKNFLFSYDEHGWSPSGIFQLFREKGLVDGKFKEIYWRGRGDAGIREL